MRLGRTMSMICYWFGWSLIWELQSESLSGGVWLYNTQMAGRIGMEQ